MSTDRSTRDRTAACAQSCMSRSTGLPPSLGKSTFAPKTSVPDEIGEEFERLARSLDMNTSELLRLLVLVRVRGSEWVLRVHQERVSHAAGIGTESGQFAAETFR